MTEPWVGFGEADGPILGNIARNYMRYGYLATKFGPAQNSGPVVNGEFTYYTTHPLALFGILISFSYRLFGVHEWSARLIPIAFSLGTLLVLYRLVRRLWDDTVAIWSLAFMTFVPLLAYYGRNVWPHSMAVFFGLLMFSFYFSWLESRRKRDFLYLMVSQVFATMSAWGGYYVALLLFLHCLLTNRKKLKTILILPLLDVVIFLLFLAHLHLLEPGSALVRLANAFLLRSNLAAPGVFDWLDFSKGVLQRILANYTVALLLIATIGIYFTVWKGKWKDSRHFWLITLFLWGCAEIFLFRQAAASAAEIQYFYYFGPFFALSGALGIAYLQARLSTLKWLGPTVVVCIVGLFLSQSLFVLYKLHNPPRYGFDRSLAMTINQNTEFNEAVITSLSPLYYYLPYYADRYFKYNVRTKEEFFDILGDGTRYYRYFITTTPALAQNRGFSPTGNSMRNIHELDTELDRHLFENYAFTVKDNWLIFFNLANQKKSDAPR